MTLSKSHIESDHGGFPIWEESIPIPDHATMPDLRVVTHILLERAEINGYHYLHESSPAWHDNSLFVCWANHRHHEINTTDELIRYRRSDDGGVTWTPPRIWAAAPMGESSSFNHPVIASQFGTLWGFFTRWDNGLPSTEIMQLQSDDRMETTGARIPRFIPFRPPERMANGNWLMSGELTWYEAAVAVSSGDDFTKWNVFVIPRPDELSLKYPETTILNLDDLLVAICRPYETTFALISKSHDYGVSWSPLQNSNLPIHASQMFGGKLSTGQNYLIFNSPAPDRRSLLAIAITKSDGGYYERVWKIRHQAYPVIRLFGGYAVEGRVPVSMAGHTTEWSYPGAIEYDGKLYVSYTQGKEDCWLSVVPLEALRCD